MKEQLISFETAKLAKEKGFDESCTNMWYYNPKYKDDPELHPGTTSHRKFVNCSENYMGCNTSDYEESTITIKDLLKKPSDYPAEKNLYPAPTQSLLQKWLREEHGIRVLESCPLPEQTRKHSEYLSKRVDSIIFNAYHKDWNPKLIEISCEDTYEEALEAGLLEGLKLIKDD